MKFERLSKATLGAAAILLFMLFSSAVLRAATPLSAEDVLKLKRVSEAAMSPDGEWIAYTVSVPRAASDEAGNAYSELYVVSAKTGEIRPFITGKVNVSSPRWNPDGSRIAFLMARGEKAKTQVWMIPLRGGEAIQVTSSETNVANFRWHPGGRRIGYVATTLQSSREKELDKKGYGFIFYEENLKPRNLYLIDIGATIRKGDIGAAGRQGGTAAGRQGDAATADAGREAGADPGGGAGTAQQITEKVSVWSFEFSPDGTFVAAGISPRNLIDENYMFQKIYVIDLATKEMRRLTDNPGKLGNFAWSPDGGMVAYNAAKELKDHAESQVYVVPVLGGEARNLTEPAFRGHVNWVGWKDKNTVVYRSNESVYPTFSTVPAAGGRRTVILSAKDVGVIFDSPSYTRDFKSFALTGNGPSVPGDLYFWQNGARSLKRLTNVNLAVADRTLGRQEVARYKARDGVEIEGLLIYPVGYDQGDKCPLAVAVHGGPEGNYSNGWVTRYSEPAQVLAGKGYVVFLPNYRSSTGYGLEFALAGYNEAGGKEFDDIADGIDYLVSQGIVDPKRVGLLGGSYGGYAAAWFASYYTDKVKAVCMFVGISDLTSKRLTTDIPYEELYVHSGKKIEDMWKQSLERSPIYWAHQCKTAVLIVGGAADTRVYPGQSLEFYRILKMNDKPAVRLVQYPGEGHGNAKQPGRIDVLYRQLDWFDWYVRNDKPLKGDMPPLDISDRYGLDLGEKTEEKR